MSAALTLSVVLLTVLAINAAFMVGHVLGSRS